NPGDGRGGFVLWLAIVYGRLSRKRTEFVDYLHSLVAEGRRLLYSYGGLLQCKGGRCLSSPRLGRVVRLPAFSNRGSNSQALPISSLPGLTWPNATWLSTGPRARRTRSGTRRSPSRCWSPRPSRPLRCSASAMPSPAGTMSRPAALTGPGTQV